MADKETLIIIYFNSKSENEFQGFMGEDFLNDCPSTSGTASPENKSNSDSDSESNSESESKLEVRMCRKYPDGYDYLWL